MFLMGSITRSRTKFIKKSHPGLVQETWVESSSATTQTPGFCIEYEDEGLT